jgi:hypothetical protein
MGICTEIYKSSAEIYIKQNEGKRCGDKGADEDAAEEEDSQNPLR